MSLSEKINIKKHPYKTAGDSFAGHTASFINSSETMLPYLFYLTLLTTIFTSLTCVEGWKIDQSCRKEGVCMLPIMHAEELY